MSKVIRGTIEYEILLDEEWSANPQQESQIVENIKTDISGEIDYADWGEGSEHWAITKVTSHIVLKTAVEG